MILPKDPKTWPEAWRVAYEERAAIREYDGRMSRMKAEILTEMDLRTKAAAIKRS